MTFFKIWQADMDNNGVIPLIKGLSENQKQPEKGYVIVDMNPMPDSGSSAGGSEANEISVFAEVVIPESKQRSYDLFMKLHDNYDWRAKEKEASTPGEAAEINEFLQFAANTAPMRLARKYAEDHHQLKAGCSTEEWINMLKSVWFTTFMDKSTSYFEHVFLGEQGSKRRKLGGHHFWYHYYVNDGPFAALKKDDSIVFIKHVEVARTEHSRLAEVITIKYTLEERKPNGEPQILIKDLGGFFVGTSAEGLMAMGTVAFLDGRQDIPVEINGERLNLAVFRRKEDGKDYGRTFFPKIAEPVRAGR
ncbi:hypothetical protein [Paenibacillus sp. S150]|uniref:hypothetical protein n=1 Tax=Paenibacillus sp. S150 TaxID=2749826 RepID=UPI001C573F73|nr:hypothetical protein [Paenibacillus sp. S150]MBW4082885.1 hypothetical protein [Paenibacillus sp. S150]